ncbi:hypothetical protein D3C86_2244050 [compost metagenome]
MVGVVLIDVKEANVVVPLTNPVITPVPPVLVMFPVLAEVMALTWRPLMVITSGLLVPEQS